MERLSTRTIIKYTILSGFTAMALTMRMNIPELTEAQTADAVREVFWNLSRSLEAGSFQAGILWAVLLFAKCKIRKTSDTETDMWQTQICSDAKTDVWQTRIFTVLNFLIAAVWLCGEGFRADDSVSLLHASKGQMLKSVLYVAGFTSGLNDLALLFLWAVKTYGRCTWNPSADGNCLKKIITWFDRYPFRTCFLTLVILWLPHIIIAYPAYFCYDSWSQIAQYFGLAEFKSHHPPVMTLVMGGVMQLGGLWNGNFGMFLFVLLQTCVIASVEAYLFVLFHEMGAPAWVRVLTMVLCVFSPWYTDYIGLFLKDNLYSYMVLLFQIELAYFLLREDTFLGSRRHMFLWIFSACTVILFRNNGKYVIYPMFLVLAVIRLAWRRGRKRQETVDAGIRRGAATDPGKRTGAAAATGKVMLLLIIPVVLSMGISSFTMQHFSITRGSIREALSLPMQQTARYVKNYGNEVTPEEKAAISTVLEYDRLASAYDPAISDPVKRLFKFYPTTGDLIIYFKVWFRQFLKHPGVYFGATLNQNYYLLYPFLPNDSIYSSMHARFPDEKKLLKLTGAKEVAALEPAKQRIAAWYEFCLRMPGLGLLSHPSTYVILLLWMMTVSVLRRRKQFLLLCLPSVLSLGIIILSPVIQDSPRYFFPVFFAAPLLLAVFAGQVRHEDTQD